MQPLHFYSAKTTVNVMMMMMMTCQKQETIITVTPHRNTVLHNLMQLQSINFDASAHYTAIVLV